MGLRLAHDREEGHEVALLLSLDLDGVWRGGDRVLGRIALTVRAGETIAITGPSGVGKTTLLRAVAGLQDKVSGHLGVSGRRAMVFQEPRLLPWRSLVQNVVIATGVAPGKAGDLLALAGLGDLADALPGELSLGQQRRVALVRAFATEPDLLLLDEPFVSLDAETAEAMIGLYARLRDCRPMATLLVTHARTEAERLATRIVTLGGRPATIMEDRQNAGAYFQLSASGVTSSRS